MSQNREQQSESPYVEDLDLRVGGLTVQKGLRVWIPTELCDGHNLYSCYTDVVVGTEQVSFPLPDKGVDKRGQFKIPKRRAQRYGVSPGDTVDIRVDGVVERE